MEKLPPEHYSTSLKMSWLGIPNQLLCHQTPKYRLLDSCDIPKEDAEGCLDLHIIWWPENKDFPEVKQRTSDEKALSRQSDQACLEFCCQTFNDAITLQGISIVYDLDDM